MSCWHGFYGLGGIRLGQEKVCEVGGMLGQLSAKYESNGDPGAIGRNAGDAGGASYGAYQFATNAGVSEAFMGWLAERGYWGAEALKQAGEPGTEEFDAAWRRVAEADTAGFMAMQHDFVQHVYYEPARVALLEIGLDIDARSEALRQVIWSAAVQYGPGYAGELFGAAAALAEEQPDGADDATLIANVYAVRASDAWTAGSPGLRPALRARFAAECREALGMLG